MRRSARTRGLVLGALAGSFVLAAGPAALAAPTTDPATASPEGIALAIRGPIGANLGQATLGHSPGGWVASGLHRGILGIGGVLTSTAQTTTQPAGNLATAEVSDLSTTAVTDLLGKVLSGVLGGGLSRLLGSSLLGGASGSGLSQLLGLLGGGGLVGAGGALQVGFNGSGGLTVNTGGWLGGPLARLSRTGPDVHGIRSGLLDGLGLGDLLSGTAAKSSCQWSSKAQGPARFTMTSDIGSLDILGVPVPLADLVHVAPNTRVTGLGTSLPVAVTLNQQEPGPTPGTMTVNAVDMQVTLPLLSQHMSIDIASSTCGHPASTTPVSPGTGQNAGNPVGPVVKVSPGSPMSNTGACMCLPVEAGFGSAGSFRSFSRLDARF